MMSESTPAAPVAGLNKLKIPTPIRIGPVNVYLAIGDPLTLIDVGPATEEAWQALLSGLAAHGYRPQDIRRVLITHHHVDHYGLAQRLVDVCRAEVIAHPYAVPWLTDPAAERARHIPFWEQLFAESGVPAEMQLQMAKVTRQTDRYARPVEVAFTITEGDTLCLGDYCWQALYTPGHAGSMICLYQPDTQILVSSDHLLRDVSSNPLIEAPPTPGAHRPRRLLDYMEQLQRVAALDVQLALPGHGENITDHRSLIEHRLKYHRARADRIVHLLSGEPMRLYDMVEPMFSKLDVMNSFLAMSEILGHLDWLEQEGRIRSTHVDGQLWWRAMNQIPCNRSASR